MSTRAAVRVSVMMSRHDPSLDGHKKQRAEGFFQNISTFEVLFLYPQKQVNNQVYFLLYQLSMGEKETKGVNLYFGAKTRLVLLCIDMGQDQ